MAKLADVAEFEFKAGSYTGGELGVVGFRGREALSQPFAFEIDLTTREHLDTEPLLGADAQLTIHPPDGGSRFVHGILSSIEYTGQYRERRRYRVMLVPRLWKLSLISRSRIFQEQSTKDIVTRVLKDAKVEHRWAVKDYPKRVFCVQYRESDLAFVSRLLEFEGIFYFFEHAEGKHTMVLGDAKDVPKPIADPRVPFRELSGTVEDKEFVYEWERAQELRSGKYSQRDYAFEKPKLDQNAEKTDSKADAKLEVYDYPGAYEDPGRGGKLAQIRLEELRCESLTGRGASLCRRLQPGFTFEIEDHPLATEKYLLVAVEHEGHQMQALEEDAVAEAPGIDYKNRFRCIPTSVVYRPPRRTPWPVVKGVQTAIVVGPAGEEIYTDQHARIKVQFHWDREGKKNEASSCWIRVSQAWAGAGWGALYIPRIGDEVVVRFLEGDPDQPIVVGSLYNGAKKPPVGLPGHKTRNVLRSNSSPGGGGSNEMTFEDSKGDEEIYLHAQKDKLINVENDKAQKVGANEALKVEKNRDRTIDQNHFLHVKLDDDSSVTGNQTISVTKNRQTTVAGDQEESIKGKQSIKVDRTRRLKVDDAATELVGAKMKLSIGAGYSVNVLGAGIDLVGALRSTQIGGLKFEKIEEIRYEYIKGSRSTKSVRGSLQFDVEGKVGLGVLGKLHEEAGRHSMLETEKHCSEVAKEIKVEAKELGIVVADELRLIINKSGTVKLWGQKITVDGDSGKIAGSKVKLKPGGGSSGKAFQEVLDPSEATSVSQHDEKNPGDLKEADAKAFKGGKYTKKVLNKDVKVKRLYGGGAKAEGRWVTKGGRPPGLEGKIRMALKPEWGNEASHVSTIVLKKGTTVYEGVVAGQGGPWAGGASQILIGM